MATLYAVTAGCYSDYHIITLTASKKRADRIAELYKGEYNQTHVEVFEDGDPDDTRILYWVGFYSGTTNVSMANDYELREEIPNKIHKYKNSNLKFDVYVLADDKDHALKIARDLLAEFRYRKEIEEVL